MNRAIATLLIRVLGLALAYWGAAKLGGMLAEPPGFAGPVWPAAGIALGALCTWGLRVWPGILIGSFFYNLNTAIAAQDAIDIGRALAIALGIAAGATLQGILGTLLVRRLVGDSSRLEDPAEIIRFLVAGGPVSCLVNASWSVGLLVGSGLIPVQQGAVSWLTWWIGDAIGVLIFAPLFFTLFGRQEDVWKPRRVTVMLPLILFLAMLTLAFGVLRYWESEQLRLELAHDADALTRNLERTLQLRMVINQTVASLYAVNRKGADSVKEEFLRHAAQQFGGALGISWAPRVTHRAREAYEQEMRSEGLSGYEIRERTGQGMLVRAGERKEYFPIRAIASPERAERLLGFDLASDKARAAALASARDSGMSVVTAPLQLLWQNGSVNGFLLITPVFTKEAGLGTPEQRRAGLLGFVSTPFRVADMIDTVVRGIAEERQLYIRLFDRSPNGEKTLLYSSLGKASYRDKNEGKSYVTEIHFGGRIWDAQFLPSIHYSTHETTWGSWYRYALLVGGLLVVSLLGTLLLIFTARERHLSLIGEAVERIGRGDRATRIPISNHGPLQAIEEGINEMAARIEESHAQLERRVSEATVELRAKKEESDAATLAKSRVLAYASHDLRQPLHALELFVAHLKQQPLNYETAKLVGNVDTCVQALGGLLDGLLDLSRLDSGLIQPAPQAVRVSELWERLHYAFAETAAAKGLKLRFRPSTLWLMTDPQLLYRILMNLVSNAIRYTRRGGVLVACRRAGNHAQLAVWDTGVGISPEHREEIFKEFVQLDNPERDRTKGLGLGLSIVERIAGLLNHRLTMRSRPGRGSCFSLDVPIADAVTLAAVSAEAPGPTESFSFADFTVLVIEDDLLARRALVDLLRSWRCVVVEAGNAEDAQRELAGGCRPDVIASDFRLPNRRSGIDLVAQARATLGHDVAAFIISGDTHADVMAAAKAAQLPLLHKPVQPARLRKMLQLLLRSSRASEA